MSTECKAPENLFWLYVSLWLAGFFSPLLYTGLNNILPSVAIEFGGSAATISFIVVLFAFSQGFFGTIGGRMSELFGLRRMMSIGFIICALTLLGLFFSTNFLMFSIFRFAQGIGTALLISCSTMIAVNVTPIHRRGAILGMLVSAAYLGISLGPLIAGALATFFGWKMFFIILLIPCLGCLVLFRHTLSTEWCTLEGEDFDTKGAILLGLGLGFISFGAGLYPNHSSFALLVPVGIVFTYFFIRTQKRVKYPVLNLDIFTKAKSFRLAIIAIFVNYGSMGAVVYFATMYFQQAREFTPFIVGVFLLFRSFAQFAFSPFAGRLADKIHPEYIVITALSICTVGIAALAFLNTESNLYYIAFLLFLMGIGIATFAAPSTVSALRDVEKNQIGIASAITGAGRSMGILFNQLIVSITISYYLGTKEVTPETVPLFLGSMKASLLILSSFNFLCLLAYIKFTMRILREEKEALKNEE